MRRRKLRALLLFVGTVLSLQLSAQGGYNTGLNGSVINLACNRNCLDTFFRVPHLKGTDDYIVSTIPYTPYAYTTPGGNEVTSIYTDDQYSAAIPMSFNFCFYDSVFSNIVIGSNGIVTFEIANASCDNAFEVPQPIPFTGGPMCTDQNEYYPRSAIMAMYSDLDPRLAASPADRKIEWRIEGTAPFRRFIVSYYHIGVFGAAACGRATPNTFQIVMYETTGIIDIYIEQKACNSTSSLGRAILGLQNWDRDKAVSPAGKNREVWNENNTAYRFFPSGGVSRYISSQLFDINNVLLLNGDTTTAVTGSLDVKFPSFCQPVKTSRYIMKTTFGGCDIAANQIIRIDTFTLNVNTLNATLVTTETDCGLTGTGIATITVPAGAGAGPYTFVLNPGGITKTAASNTFFAGLAAGNYTVEVSDGGTCTSPLPFTITSKGVLDITFTATNTTCSGASNGRIEIDPPNGTPPLVYSLDGINFNANNIFANLAPGNYAISVRDNAGCVANNIPVTIDPGLPITITTTSTPTSCPGLNNGTITVVSSTGTAPYTYSIMNGPYQANPTFTGLAPGSYFIGLRDAVGCVTTLHLQEVLPGATTLTLSTLVTPTSCNGNNDGSIVITPISGTGPYEYSIDNGTNWQTGNTFNGLAPGNYSVRIREGGACLSSLTPTIVTAGPALRGTIVSRSTACIGANNGSITITPDPVFTGPFEYSLNGNPFQPSNTFTGLAAANYTIVFRNAAGCTSGNVPVIVTAGTVLTGTVAGTPATCNGAADGVITATADNGSAPYQYSLDGGPLQASNVFNGVGAGVHNVTIRDAFNCVSSPIAITINQPTALMAPVPLVNPVTCNGTNTGRIVVSPTGGTYPYTYSLDNITFAPDSIFTLARGTYTIYVRDAQGCRLQFNNVIITEPAALTGIVNGTGNATCAGGNDGNIQVTATGGTLPYSYSNDGINFQPSNQLNVRNGTYSVTIRDANNCTFVIPNVAVGLTDNLILTAATPAPICEGTTAQLEATGNAAAYSWSSVNNTIVNPVVYNPVVSPVVTSTFTVTATLGNCLRTADVIVTVLPAPVANAGINGDICYGQDYQLQGSGGVIYTWTPTTYLDNNAIPDPQVIKPLKTITYSLQVTDANNCKSLQPAQVRVDVTPPIKVNITPLDTVVQAGAQFQLTATSIGTDYTWTPATGLSDPGISNPVVTAGAEGANIIYKVITTTPAGCEGEGLAVVKVYKGPELYVPTAFTPNNDGKNDMFFPFPVGIKQLNYFRVFNRWGQLLYATTTLQQGWDGKMGGKEQASDVYIWMVQGVTGDGTVVSKSGTVTLIR